MTKYEKRQFFDRLCQLRSLYLLRGVDDLVSEMTIDEGIAYGERLMASAAELARTLGEDGSEAAESITSDPAQA